MIIDSNTHVQITGKPNEIITVPEGVRPRSITIRNCPGATLRGAWIENSLPAKLGSDSALIYVENSPNFRLERSAVVNCNTPDEMSEFKYVYFKRSPGSQVLYCTLAQKYGLGLALGFYTDDLKEIGNYVVDHCLFQEIAARGKAASLNGTEAIRLLDSARSRNKGQSKIINNLFVDCGSPGEPEVVSIKCEENEINGNVLINCQGGLTSRHGRNNVFRRNHIKGGAVGIRIIDSGHIVEDNYIEGQRGAGGYRGGIVLLYGKPNSKPNEYFPANGVTVRNNALNDCELPISVTNMGKSELTLEPVGYVLENNGPVPTRPLPLTLAMVGANAGDAPTVVTPVDPPVVSAGDMEKRLAALEEKVAMLESANRGHELRWSTLQKAVGQPPLTSAVLR